MTFCARGKCRCNTSSSQLDRTHHGQPFPNTPDLPMIPAPAFCSYYFEKRTRFCDAVPGVAKIVNRRRMVGSWACEQNAGMLQVVVLQCRMLLSHSLTILGTLPIS